MYVQAPPNIDEILARLDPQRALRAFGGVMQAAEHAGPSYLHWDKLRHLEPPEDLSHEEWWLSLKIPRRALYRRLPLVDQAGRSFVYTLPDEVQRLLHFVDQRCSGEVAMPDVVIGDDQARRHYLVNSLMEEAIRSSQLEGATTSRRVAKELLTTGRAPKNRSEKMIANNYSALEYMRGVGDELTPAIVLELQRILTEGTLDDPDAAGRLQTPTDERVAVYDRLDGALIHTPPPAEQLSDRLEAMCVFTNSRDEERFIHPVVRAILLHFWLAYDHPFEDGNGRTARALFSWSLRTQGYWLVEYLSISRILRDAPSQYTRAFLLTETDERDTTYFILSQLEVMQRAIDGFQRYLRRKLAEVRDIERRLREAGEFNHRQLALLSEAVRNDDRRFSFGSHAATHGVTHETARSDLLELFERGLLERRKSGRTYIFTPAANLPQQLAG